MSLSTWPVSRTPSAAVGSSRITTLLPKAAARATATACRCPPDSVSTAWLMFCRVLMPRRLICSVDCRFISPVSSMRNTEPRSPFRRISRARNRLLGDVERRGDGERLVDGLDAGVPGVLRAF